MIWVVAHECEHDKEILDENTSNFLSQKSLRYEFSTLDETVKEEEGVKSSLCNLKLRNLNRLIFGQININSIRNTFELLFSLVSNNIDVLLISETKTVWFYQISLYIHFSRESFHLSINYTTIFRSLGVLLYAATHSTKFPQSMLQKIYFSKRMTAPQTSQAVNINAK